MFIFITNQLKCKYFINHANFSNFFHLFRYCLLLKHISFIRWIFLLTLWTIHFDRLYCHKNRLLWLYMVLYETQNINGMLYDLCFSVIFVLFCAFLFISTHLFSVERKKINFYHRNSSNAKSFKMQRPNFQMIEDSPEKNYMRYVSQYKLDDMVRLSCFYNSLTQSSLWNIIFRWKNWNCWIMREHFWKKWKWNHWVATIF